MYCVSLHTSVSIANNQAPIRVNYINVNLGNRYIQEHIKYDTLDLDRSRRKRHIVEFKSKYKA